MSLPVDRPARRCRLVPRDCRAAPTPPPPALRAVPSPAAQRREGRGRPEGRPRMTAPFSLLQWAGCVIVWVVAWGAVEVIIARMPERGATARAWAIVIPLLFGATL